MMMIILPFKCCNPFVIDHSSSSVPDMVVGIFILLQLLFFVLNFSCCVVNVKQFGAISWLILFICVVVSVVSLVCIFCSVLSPNFTQLRMIAPLFGFLIFPFVLCSVFASLLLIHKMKWNNQINERLEIRKMVSGPPECPNAS